jgi:hypothetical protein
LSAAVQLDRNLHVVADVFGSGQSRVAEPGAGAK